MKITIRPADGKTPALKLLFLALVVYILLVASVFPFRQYESFTGGPTCLFKRFTGMPCFFCGITSSLLSSFRLNLRDAFFLHPAGVFVFLAFIVVIISVIYQVLNKKSISITLSKREKVIIAIGIFTILLVNWIFKIIM